MEGQKPKLEILKSNLTGQIALYKELLTIVRAEKNHLMSVSINEIQEATFAKEVLLVELQSKENERKRWLIEVSDHFKSDVDELDIEGVLGLYKNEDRENILKLRNTLRVLIQSVKDFSLENQNLIANALKDSQVMKENALGISQSKTKTYGPKGGIDKPDESARIFSSKV